MIPVADATGGDISPSGLAGFVTLKTKAETRTQNRGTSRSLRSDTPVCLNRFM